MSQLQRNARVAARVAAVAFATLAVALCARPAFAQTFGAGMICWGPLSQEPVNHVRLSREGCEISVSIGVTNGDWAWGDGVLAAAHAFVWPVGYGAGAEGWMGHYQHELQGHVDKGLVIWACASGGPRLGRGGAWIGAGLGLCSASGTGSLGAPMLTPTIPIRAQVSVPVGGLRLGLRPAVDLFIPRHHGFTVFQEWARCPIGTVGKGCSFHEDADWRATIMLHITIQED